VAAIWFSRLLNGKQPIVFEDGGQLRDFVSIHDVVDCLVLMLEKPGADTCRSTSVGRDGHDPRHRPLLARLLGRRSIRR
jgi:dTDP-L-rhamnose 4-epimerase